MGDGCEIVAHKSSVKHAYIAISACSCRSWASSSSSSSSCLASGDSRRPQRQPTCQTRRGGNRRTFSALCVCDSSRR